MSKTMEEDISYSRNTCYNQYGLEHTMVFGTLHVILFLCQHLPFREHRLLTHYILVWMALLSLPKGQLLDTWLTIMLAMDFLPMVLSLIYTWWTGWFSLQDQWIPSEALLKICSLLETYCPIYKIHYLTIQSNQENLGILVFSIMTVAYIVTRGREFLLGQLYYCRRDLPPLV